MATLFAYLSYRDAPAAIGWMQALASRSRPDWTATTAPSSTPS
jgi:hypothetical protein